MGPLVTIERSLCDGRMVKLKDARRIMASSLPCAFVIENASQIRPAYSGAQCGVSRGLGLIIYQGARMAIWSSVSGAKAGRSITLG
jgi:hypothetical protein